ncbi:NAD-dependent epimerase/dehydratase family protein [Xanthobacter aminoxidans]|uniref:NAD-dependent epimerase/dehydratase family protein n=1 Tax=Xanthobacter aminoxidans TaxID=186280 RepID=UPI002022BABC|nr:NAD-dependent epimerase/dehydratase family protein [Xanthobacter aminoxidans]MCL8382351.1 NAD-dependent epimerase/dehydratase family protein [Xanthobacter aminoxidans]
MVSLVIGGSGLIGRGLCERLSKSEIGVIATTRTPGDLPAHPRVRWEVLDLSTFDDWARLLKDVDTVYHLAWSTIPSIAAHDPARDILENVVGTVRMLEASRRVPGLRIVFASSGGSVYGASERLPICEEHPTRPMSAYGVSKLMVEHYIDKYRALYGVDGVALRISNCYGARQNERKGLGAVTLFARAGLRNEPIKLFGNGEVVRDYVHVDDVVGALVAAGVRHNVSGPINIGAGKGHSLNQVVAKLEAALGRRLQIERVAARAFDVRASVLDVRRAQERIGWRPTIGLDLGIEMILSKLRAEMDIECGSPFLSIATTRSTFTGRKATQGS